MKYLILVAAFSTFLFACKPNTEKTSTSETNIEVAETPSNVTEADIMKIHDEVMPIVGEFNNIKAQFKILAKESQIEKVREANVKLVEADDAMMTWMAEYKLPTDSTLMNEFFVTEHKKISVIAQKIKSAKANAQALLMEVAKSY